LGVLGAWFLLRQWDDGEHVKAPTLGAATCLAVGAALFSAAAFSNHTSRPSGGEGTRAQGPTPSPSPSPSPIASAGPPSPSPSTSPSASPVDGADDELPPLPSDTTITAKPSFSGLKVGDDNFVDLDTGVSSDGPSRDSEILLTFGRIEVYGGSRFGDEAMGCSARHGSRSSPMATPPIEDVRERATSLRIDVWRSQILGTTRALCISISKQVWAVLKPVDSGASDSSTFDVWLFGK
jgi:hypothetical protein